MNVETVSQLLLGAAVALGAVAAWLETAIPHRLAFAAGALFALAVLIVRL